MLHIVGGAACVMVDLDDVVLGVPNDTRLNVHVNAITKDLRREVGDALEVRARHGMRGEENRVRPGLRELQRPLSEM